MLRKVDHSALFANQVTIILLSILAFILKQGRGTVAECEAALKENRRTLQRDLKMLVDKSFLREVGSGPTDPTKFYEPLL